MHYCACLGLSLQASAHALLIDDMSVMPTYAPATVSRNVLISMGCSRTTSASAAQPRRHASPAPRTKRADGTSSWPMVMLAPARQRSCLTCGSSKAGKCMQGLSVAACCLLAHPPGLHLML